MPQDGFVAVLVIELHFPDAGSLKTKRRDLQSIRSLLRTRYGATVAEIAHQDRWQRSTLLAAVTSPAGRVLDETLDSIERWLIERCPSGVQIERIVASLGDVREAFPARFSLGG
jgi:uncharacterized protein YlxP (DUF503 family)